MLVLVLAEGLIYNVFISFGYFFAVPLITFLPLREALGWVSNIALLLGLKAFFAFL